MSLINKVLQDLEARRDTPGIEITRPVLAELRPAMGAHPPVSRKRTWTVLLVAGLLAVGAVSAAGFYGWNRWVDGDSAVPQPLVAKAEKARIRETAANPVNAPAPVSVLTQARATTADETQQASAPARSALPVPPGPAVKTVDTQLPVVSPKTEPPRTVAAATAVRAGPAPAQKSAPQQKAATENRVPVVAKAMPVSKPSSPVTESQKPKRDESAATVVQADARQEPSDEASDGGQMEKKNRPMTPQEKAENAYREAARKFRRQQIVAAERDLRLALENDPQHVKARELLAGILLQRGRRSDAQMLLEQGLEHMPAHASFILLLARIYFDYGADLKALTLLENSRQDAEANADYQAFMATLYQRAGRHQEAIQAYSRALSLSPREDKWWVGLGISLEAEQKWGGARNAYQRAAASGTLDRNLISYAQQRMAALKNR